MSEEGLTFEPPKGRLKRAEPNALSDLIQQYDQALIDNAEKIASCEKSKDDYVNLRKRLATISDKLEYAAMLPLGTRALCPGKIIHTNEIMCQLGDNWYVETSSKTASGIVSHRLKKCDEMLTSLKKEEELYRSWRDEANRQKTEASNEGTIEIHEEYDEEKEKLWRIFHRESMRKHHQKLAKEKKQNSEQLKDDTDIWTRLDELELEEELEQAGMSLEELLLEDKLPDSKKVDVKLVADPIISNKSSKDSENNIKSAPILQASETLPVKSSKGRGKKVTFNCSDTVFDLGNGEEDRQKALQLMFPYMHQNNDTTDSVNVNPQSSSTVINEPLVIHFKHSQQFLCETQTNQSESDAEEYNSTNQLVISPGDIYKYFSGRGQNSSEPSPSEEEIPPTKVLKSILKPHTNSSFTNSPTITEDNVGRKNVLMNQSSISLPQPQKPVTSKNKPKPQKVRVQEAMPLSSMKDIVVERPHNNDAAVVNNQNRGNSSVQSLPGERRAEKGAKPVSLFKQARSMK